MNEARTNIDPRGPVKPAGGRVGVLYDLPAQQVGACGPDGSLAQVTTVREALDRVTRAMTELSLPVHEPESLKSGLSPYPNGRMPLPGGGRDSLVVPGRPIPRFRFPYEGR